MNTLLIEILEPDSGPSQNLHQSLHKETLNGHSLVSLSSNRDGSSPISSIAPFPSKTLDRSSSSIEDTETLDDNHDSHQSLVHFGPQPLSISMGLQKNVSLRVKLMLQGCWRRPTQARKPRVHEQPASLPLQ
ncbi:hypothetical protein Pint_07606 [Pistacia integerrima]|uniref:Uncharacterized protein n=1 Tax=Pistacia integerrima TaxID=434235 RepID=A0ACC0Y195_9ROSI|nr:hypothetical protein Pint_07606 [Pistacia integerrima]